MDRNEQYRSRLLADRGEVRDYIAIRVNKLPMVARLEKGTPSMYGSRLNRLNPSSSIWDEAETLDEAYPMMAVGFSAYLLFCRTEVGREAGYHNFDWDYISKEQCFQLYIDRLFNVYRGANKELYSIKVANGKADEFKANFLSSLSKEEKVYLKRSMELGYINSDIINEAKEFLSSLTESEEKQANEPPYLFAPCGIDFSKILSLLKEVSRVDTELTYLDFLNEIRNGRLGCIRVNTYKKIVIKEVGKRMGEDWLETALSNEGFTRESLNKPYSSREAYTAFHYDLKEILRDTEHF